MDPRRFRGWILLVILARLVLVAEPSENTVSLAALAKNGWHCYDGREAPSELPTDRAPCLKVIHPTNGFAIIPSSEDHFRFVIGVTPPEAHRPSLPIHIEWLEIKKGNTQETGQLRQIQECQNQRVCEVRISRVEPHQAVYLFHVSVGYLGRAPTASDDILLEVEDSGTDFTADLASASKYQPPLPPAVTTGDQNPVLLPRDRQNSRPAPRMVQADDSHRTDAPMFFEADDQRAEGGPWDRVPDQNGVLGPSDEDVMSFNERTDLPFRASVTRRRAPVNRPVSLPDTDVDYDYSDRQVMGKLPPAHHGRITDDYYDDDADFPIAETRDNLRDPVRHPLRLPQPPRLLDESQPGSLVGLGNTEEDTEVDNTELLLDAIDSINEKLSPATTTPSPAVVNRNMKVLSKGIDDVRTNVTKIFGLLSNRKRQADTYSKETGGHHEKPKLTDRTSEKNGTRNDSLLGELGQIVHGLRDQKCRHLLKTYTDFKNRLHSTKHPSGQVSKPVDTDENDEHDADTSLDSPSVVKGAQRRLASISGNSGVKGDFLKMWNEIGLTGDDAMPNQHRRRKTKQEVNSNGEKAEGKHNDATHFDEKPKLNGFSEPTTDGNLQTEYMTILTPEPGVLVRQDLIVHPNPVTDDLREADLLPDDNLQTRMNVIITPEPDVFLRQDLVLIHPTPTQAESYDSVQNPESGGSFEQSQKEDNFQTELREIVTPEPGIILRQDLVLIHPENGTTSHVTNQIQPPDLFLEPFPHLEEKVEYQTALIPTVIGKITKGHRTQVHDLEAQSSTNSPQDVGFEIEFDDTGIFDDGAGTSQPTQAPPIETRSMTAKLLDGEMANVDQVFHRLKLGPSVMPQTSTRSQKPDFKGPNSLQIYENPFPDLNPVPTQRQKEENVKLPLPVDSHENVDNRKHKLVNVSITGKVEAGNLEYFSEMLDLLKAGEASSQLTKHLLPPADGRGNNLVLINQEDHGIYIGNRDFESGGVQPNITLADEKGDSSSRIGKIVSGHQHRKKPSREQMDKTKIHIHIEDDDGYQVNIHKEAEADSSNGGSGGVQQAKKSRKNAWKSKSEDNDFETNEERDEMDFGDDNDDTLADDEEMDQIEKELNSVDRTRVRRARRHLGVTGGKRLVLEQDSKREQKMTGAKDRRKLTNTGANPSPADGNQKRSNRLRRQDPEYDPSGQVQVKPPPSSDQTDPVTTSPEWSDWSSWSSCSETCGKGILVRKRTCSPENRDDLCTGSGEESTECIVDACLEEEKAEDIVQEEGHSTEIDCRYDTSKTPTEIYWMSPTGEKITKESVAFSDKFKITGSQLIVRGVQSEDAGTYHCVVIMADNTSETADAKIDVLTCKNNPCKNGGSCVEHDGSNGHLFQCVCTVEFEGHTCDQVSSLFIGDTSMSVIAFCILVAVVVGLFFFYKNRKPKKREPSQPGASPTTVIQMDSVPPDKPLLSDAEIDLFREISREEFKNFKSSHSYSLFKGKKESTPQATLDTTEIVEPITEADREGHDGLDEKPSVTGSKESQSAMHKESVPDATSRRKSSKQIASTEKVVGTPTKKSSSAESVSLPPSPAPAIEQVEQQRSTHIALSPSQGQASVEDVLSLAGYQESKPRGGSVSSVLSGPVPVSPLTMQKRSSLVDSKIRSSGSSVSGGSTHSRSSISRAKKALFTASQTEHLSSRHSVIYDEDREAITGGVSMATVSRHSRGSHPRVDSAVMLSRTGSVSTSSHAAPLIVKSSSGKLRAVRYEEHIQQRTPSFQESPPPVASPRPRRSSVYSSHSATLDTGRVEGSQAWIPIEESTTYEAQPVIKTHTPSESESLIRETSLPLSSAGSLDSCRQSDIKQVTQVTASIKDLSRHLVSDAGPSSVSVANDKQSENAKSLSEDATYSVAETQVYQHPTYESLSKMNISKSKISGTGGSAASTVCTAPLIVKSSSGNLRAVVPKEQSDIKQVTQVTASIEDLSRHLVSDAGPSSVSVANDKQSEIAKSLSEDATYSVAETQVYQHPTYESLSEMNISKSKISGTGGSAASTVCAAPLIVKSSSGNLRAVVPEEHHKQRRHTLAGSPKSSESYTRRSSVFSSPRVGSVASTKRSSGVLEEPTMGTAITPSEEEGTQAAQVSRPSKFGFPAYTRRFSLPPDPGPPMDDITEKPSSHEGRETTEVSIMRRASSLGSCLSHESHASLPSAVLTAKEISRVLSGKTLSFVNAEQSASTEELPPKSASQEDRKNLITASSYHTAITDFSDTNNADVEEKTPSLMLDSQTHLERDTHDADSIAMATSHHWQPLPEFDQMDEEYEESLQSQQTDMLRVTQSEEKAQPVLSSTPKVASTVGMASSKDELLSDWRPLSENPSVDGGTDVDCTNVNRVISSGLGPVIPIANPDDNMAVVDSEHAEQDTSQTRRGSKFGYPGYVERFSHLGDNSETPTSDHTLVEHPTEDQIHDSLLATLANLVDEPSESLSSSQDDEDEADLPFDDARERMSERED
ncbi:uncharacterized protein LOC119736055 [Patiria miniata]|uniref:Uncharacterized protein n=1 Tax=Patiria miniata TaxID=46514 RepID=A0A914AQF0_PATMI|nr:uncharacterized protein LOC119736055 [Patiria miniata]